MKNENKKPRVVILGAGFGGLACALKLAKKCGDDCEIVLVDKNPAHLYTPLLYQIASGCLSDSSKGCVYELRESVCVSLNDFSKLSGKKYLSFKRAEITGVDKTSKQVFLKDGELLDYDYLVVALGSESKDFEIKGVNEYAFKLKTIENGLNVRKRLNKFIASHLSGTEEVVSVAICGGGATGVEVAAEFAVFFEELRKQEIIRHRHARITIIDSGATLLSGNDMTVRRWAEERLRALGVEVLVQNKVLEVNESGVVVGPASEDAVDKTERLIEANMVLWTAGIKPSKVVGTLPFELDQSGRIVISSEFLVKGESDVFALGDATSLIQEETKKPVMYLAQSAMLEGKYAADNICRLLKNKTLVSYKLPTRWPSVVTLGGKYAVATVGSLHIRGRIAYYLRKIADLDYFMKILPMRYALQVFRHGISVYLKPDSK
ncbi:MAG: NAD(P)/FAD-dependent oxidoreductase [bacterium]